MEWTQNKPTELGCYWYKETWKSKPEPVEIEMHEGITSYEVVWKLGNEEWQNIDYMNGWWKGPIEP